MKWLAVRSADRRLAARAKHDPVVRRLCRTPAQSIARALGDEPHVDLAGRTPLNVAAAVIARADLLVCADTGLLHLAHAVGPPTVHLFDPGVLSKWAPPGRHFTTIAARVPCSPCKICSFTPPCCQGMSCMLEIGTARVLDEVVRRLAGAAIDTRGEATA